MRNYIKILIVSSAIVLSLSNTFAQDKVAVIDLSFGKEDSLNVCKATVKSDGKPVAEVSVKVGIKRLFGLLPVGEATTDEAGVARFEVPSDIPGDAKGNLTLVAKIEDDDNYQNVEIEKVINWGVVKKESEIAKRVRSLSASRENAPIYFIIVSNLIIIAIWGTILYVILQVFKIKRIGRLSKKV